MTTSLRRACAVLLLAMSAAWMAPGASAMPISEWQRQCYGYYGAQWGFVKWFKYELNGHTRYACEWRNPDGSGVVTDYYDADGNYDWTCVRGPGIQSECFREAPGEPVPPQVEEQMYVREHGPRASGDSEPRRSEHVGSTSGSSQQSAPAQGASGSTAGAPRAASRG